MPGTTRQKGIERRLNALAISISTMFGSTPSSQTPPINKLQALAQAETQVIGPITLTAGSHIIPHALLYIPIVQIVGPGPHWVSAATDVSVTIVVPAGAFTIYCH